MQSDKEKKTFLKVFLQGHFSTNIEDRLAKNWDVLPLEIFDECRKQGVRFIHEHKRAVSLEQVPKLVLTREGPVEFPFPLSVFEDFIKEEDMASAIRLGSESGITTIGSADKLNLKGQTRKILYTVESEKFEDFDKFSEYRERLLSDLILVFSSIQNILQEKKLEVVLDLVDISIYVPKALRKARPIDTKPVIEWIHNTFGLQQPEIGESWFTRIDVDWKEGNAQKSLAISKGSLHYQIAGPSIEGDPIEILKSITSLLAGNYRILDSIQNIAFEKKE